MKTQNQTQTDSKATAVKVTTDLNTIDTEVDMIQTDSVVLETKGYLNRLAGIKQELKALKGENEDTMTFIFSNISKLMNEHKFKSLETLSQKQKRVLVIAELKEGLDSEDEFQRYPLSVLSTIEWYYESSKLSLKKEAITYKNLRALKGTHQYYSASSVNKLIKSTATLEEYKAGLNKIIDSAKLVKTVAKLLKAGDKQTRDALKQVPLSGFKTIDNGKHVSVKLTDIDYRAVNSFIEARNELIKKLEA